MCRMNPNGSTRGIRTDPQLQAGYSAEYSGIGSIRYVISGAGYPRAKDIEQAAAGSPFALHAAPRMHDIPAGQERDRPNLDPCAARASARLRARKSLRPHDCAADIRFQDTKVVVSVNPMNFVLRLYLTAATGQGASRITY